MITIIISVTGVWIAYITYLFNKKRAEMDAIEKIRNSFSTEDARFFMNSLKKFRDSNSSNINLWAIAQYPQIVVGGNSKTTVRITEVALEYYKIFLKIKLLIEMGIRDKKNVIYYILPNESELFYDPVEPIFRETTSLSDLDSKLRLFDYYRNVFK